MHVLPPRQHAPTGEDAAHFSSLTRELPESKPQLSENSFLALIRYQFIPSRGFESSNTVSVCHSLMGSHEDVLSECSQRKMRNSFECCPPVQSSLIRPESVRQVALKRKTGAGVTPHVSGAHSMSSPKYILFKASHSACVVTEQVP